MLDKDIEIYKKEIHNLLSYYKTPLLKDKIQELIPNQSNSVYFKIRGEIGRLMGDCSRLIDFRDKVKKEDCIEFEFEGKRHFLSEELIVEYKRLFKKYGKYTIGLYEELLEYGRNIQKNKNNSINKYLEKIEEEKEDKKEIKDISFSNFHVRTEERMNFSVQVKIYEYTESSLRENIKNIKAYYNRNQQLDFTEAVTTDISLNGLGLKLPKDLLDVNKKIVIRFVGVEAEIAIGQPFLEYQVVNKTILEDRVYYALKRLVNKEEEDLNKEMEIYIKSLIQGYKRRYKVSIDNIEKAVIAKGYEQYFISKSNCLPVFLEENEENLIPRYIFNNDNNIELKEYLNFNQEDVLSNVFENINFKEELKNKKTVSFLAIFFIEKNGSRHFYAKTQLKEFDESFKKFIAYGSKLKTLKVFKYEFIDIDIKKDAFVKSSLPVELLKSHSPNDIKMLPSIEQKIYKLNKMLVLTDISTLCFEEKYKKIQINESDLLELKRCQLSKNSNQKIEWIVTDNSENREEDRYLYQTEVIFDLIGQKYRGYTVDMSAKGFRVRIDKRIPEQNLGSKINVSFIDFENNEKFNMKNQPYKIIMIRGDIISCKFVGDEKNHEGVNFWKKYIYLNYEKLRLAGNKEVSADLSRALRNIYAKNHNNIAAFFNLDNKALVPKVIAVSEHIKHNSNFIKKIGYHGKDSNKFFKSLFFNQNFLTHIQNGYDNLNKEEVYKNTMLFINVKKLKATIMYKTIFEDQIGNEKELKNYLYPEDESETFVFDLQISKRGRIINKYFKNELLYVQSYYKHKAEILMKEITDVNAIVEFKDITKFIKNEYKNDKKDLT